MQLLGLITLKQNESADEYERWVREVVHPAALNLPSVSTYDVYRVAAPFRPGGPVPYQFVEVVAITSLEDVRRDFALPETVELLKEFARRADAVFLTANQLT